MADVMDILGLDDMEQENTSMDDLNSESISLIMTNIDQSGSIEQNHLTGTMRKCLASFKKDISESKEKDEMLVAKGTFNNSDINVSGYKKIEEYDVSYISRGGTPLYDSIILTTEKLINYMTFLKDQGMRVKAVFSVFSDGEDTTSRATLSQAKKSIEKLNQMEVTTAFIGLGAEAVAEAKRLQFVNIFDIIDAKKSMTPEQIASTLRRAFNVLSKSVIESSKSVVAQADDFFTM